MKILEKYHRIHADIDLDAIRKNVENLMALTKPGTKGAAVIKTDGYGHGAVPIAKTIDDLVDFYCVATVNEAMNLRNNQITKPILVLGYTNEAYENMMIEQEIRPVVYTKEMMERISQKAEKLGKKAKVHLALDTGMGRIGFRDNEESAEIIAEAAKLPGLEIEGLFTHFAKADEADLTHAYGQHKRFTDFVEALRTKGVEIPVVHCANSAAIMEMPQADHVMVRMGVSLYGLYPSDEVHKDHVKLYPALSLKSQVIYVKDIEKGESVSYGGTFVAEKKTTVATISAGYGDGYFRNLSNKGYVLIHGKKAPIIGRVCMDQFMVDVSDIPDVKIEDEVTLIGRDGDQTITVEELAALAGTFNYELVCDLGKRIPRVYYKNHQIVGSKDYFNDPFEFLS